MSPSTTINPNAEPHEADLIAPWRAIDRLDEADAAALELMLADDPSLARRLDVAADERDGTVALNEALPSPSRGSLDRLFERIETHEAARAPKMAGVMSWLASKLSLATPGQLAWGATAAALLIAVQTGIISSAYLGGGGGATYETASDGQTPATLGTTALVAFQPSATAEQIAAALSGAGAEIVGGPKPGGVFVVRLSSEKLEGEKLEAALKPLKDAKAVVKFATPGGAQ